MPSLCQDCIESGGGIGVGASKGEGKGHAAESLLILLFAFQSVKQSHVKETYLPCVSNLKYPSPNMVSTDGPK